jgi:hypothetical protein
MPSFRLLRGSAGWLPIADVLRHVEFTTRVETGPMRAARAAPAGAARYRRQHHPFREAEWIAGRAGRGTREPHVPIGDAGSLGRRPRRPVRLSQRCLGSRYLGSRLSSPGPGARVPAVALRAEGLGSACLAAGSTRRPRKHARARSGRRNTSPGSCPPAPSQHAPFSGGLRSSAISEGSAIRLRLPQRPAAHTSQTTKEGRRLDDGR